MLNIKWGVFPGGAAFILSLAVGLLSGAAPLTVILRALLFAVVFAAAGMGARLAVDNFIPELLSAGDSGGADSLSAPPGSRIDISLGDVKNAALPEKDGDSGDDTVGDIADLAEAPRRNVSAILPEPDAGIDQNSQNEYNEGALPLPGADHAVEGTGIDGAGGNAAPPVSGGDFGGLPDLDSFAGAFLSGGGEDSREPVEEAAPAAPERRPTGNKPQKFEGDFSPKEIAAGIRTVLEKEKR